MKKILSLIFKIAAVPLGIAAILFLALYLIYNSPIPKGTKGDKADNLALKISSSIDYEAYKNTDFISWKALGYSYLWNKSDKTVTIKWNDNHILYNQDFPHKSTVNSPKSGTQEFKNELIATAEKRFNNDSFWLVAPFKLFDTGVERRYIEATEDENASLLVTYTSGGNTPGDSYQWFVDENFVPTHFKMWVSIIPIGGVPASWSNWKKTQTGVTLAHEKKIFNIVTFPMSDIKTWNN